MKSINPPTRRNLIIGIIVLLALALGYAVYAGKLPGNTLEGIVSREAEEAGNVSELHANNKDCFEDKQTLLDPKRNAECIPVMEEVLSRTQDQHQRSTEALVTLKETKYDSLGSERQKLVDDLITLNTSSEYKAFFEAENELSESILSFRRYAASKNLTRESIASDPAVKTYTEAIDASERKAKDTHQKLVAYVQASFSGEYAEIILRSLGAGAP
jgi:hypothetical protein